MSLALQDKDILWGRVAIVITYQQEPLCKFIPDVNSLVALDWEEVGRPEIGYHLEPDWDLYHLLEDSGNLRVFTVRSEGKSYWLLYRSSKSKPPLQR
jgi:hypothetical protein